MPVDDGRERHELRFDRQQAGSIADFLADELSHQGAASFRLMLDVFPGSLDLTSFDGEGVERTHIHPRPVRLAAAEVSRCR